MIRKKNILFLLPILLIFFTISRSCAQAGDSVSKRNIAVMVGCSILEGNGIRTEFLSFFYGSKRHAFAIAPAGRINNDGPLIFGVQAGYFCFIEPSFRDITFFLNYNTAYYFENNATFTHIFAIGTQVDIGKRGFMLHSVGFGFQQSAANFNWVATAGQLKLSIGIYIREIPVVHIHDDWEKNDH